MLKGGWGGWVGISPIRVREGDEEDGSRGIRVWVRGRGSKSGSGGESGVGVLRVRVRGWVGGESPGAEAEVPEPLYAAPPT